MFPALALPAYHRRSFVAPFGRLRGALVLIFVLLALPLSAARAELLYGVRWTHNGRATNHYLVSFDSATPATLTEVGRINGLGGRVTAIAFRPATGQLYTATHQVVLNGANPESYFTRLYTINLTTGAATAVGSSIEYLGISDLAFNPVDDTLRAVDENGRNITFNPNTGAMTNYGPMTYADGDVNAGRRAYIDGIAYAYNPAGAGSATLYGLDYVSTEGRILATIGSAGGSPVSPNDSKVFTVTNVASTGAVSGFDISRTTGVAYVNISGGLYTLNLSTGQLIPVDDFGTDLIGVAVAPPPPAPVSKWTPVDVAVNRTDNTSRLLWKETTNRYAVWKLSDTGAIQTGKYYGPVSGYTCDQIAVSPNGQTTLLWKNEGTKQAALWTLAPDLSSLIKATVYNYPAGYTPQNLAADASSDVRLSWRKTANNAIALWTITPSTGAITASAVYGPYANLQDGPLAVGEDGLIRLLWRNTQTGGAVVWTIRTAYGPPSAGYTYSPVAGAFASDIAVGADNKTRLQWSYTTGADVGKVALWKINTTLGGTGAIESGKFYGPIAGVSPTGLSLGGDNRTRLLWKYTTGASMGKAAFWVLSDPLTTISTSYTYGPIF